jgi:RNA polymerase sigma-70 factor (ECF subfamily)
VQLFQRDRDALGVIARGSESSSESAFLALVDRHQAALLRLADYWLGDPAAAERAVEQTWRTLLAQLERFDAKAPLKVCLFGVLLKLLREQTVVADSAELDDVGPAVDPARFTPPGDRWEGHWRKPPTPWPESARVELNVAGSTVVDQAIRSLPRTQRAVLVLRDMEGLESSYVDQVLEIGEDVQAQRLHAARSAVRAALDQHYRERKQGAR